MTITREELNGKLYDFERYMTLARCDKMRTEFSEGIYKGDLLDSAAAFVEFCLTGSVTMKHKIAIEETYLIEFEVEADDSYKAQEKAEAMWNSNDDSLPEKRFTHANIMVDNGSWNDLADYQPWLYEPRYVVEIGNDERTSEEVIGEYREFIDAFNRFMEIKLNEEGDWKYLQIDYVDEWGEYHPEMNVGVMHEQYEEG